ncbi:fibronectin type III domain-containing protein [Nonomuraea lactucae]|uniref:fibronectin type III domain-containing protein n=1 Tax=Nonomuraea lactucae TaxID=2249762 RepID=UPI000DE4B21D|nr:fibronectin type III domain-containing protein [Nonomuraea lactucae]
MRPYPVLRSRTTRQWVALPVVAILTAGLLVGTAPQVSANVGTDITNNGGTITAQYSRAGFENYPNLFDDDTTTKYFSGSSWGWVQYRSPSKVVVNRYTITSAGDAPDRDPSKWTLQGSADGATWTTLDTQTGQTFEQRGMTRGYSMPNTTAYDYYRLDVTGTNGSPDLQYAEWQLWAGGDRVPQAPSDVRATAADSGKVDVAWKDNSNDDTGYAETGFQIERSTDGTSFSPLTTTAADTTRFTDTGAAAGKNHYYRVRAVAEGGLTSVHSNTAFVSGNTAVDISDNGGTITAQYPGEESENHLRLIDNDPATKYFSGSSWGWVQYRSPAKAVVNRYTITSANDAAERDPSRWTLQGSADGATWTTLDTRTGQTFKQRGMTRGYSMPNTTAYDYYRLTVTDTNGSPDLQYAEWELWVDDRLLQAPGTLLATAVDSGKVDVAWKDNSNDETGYAETGFQIERSTDGTSFSPLTTTAANTTRFTDTGAAAGKKYYYRVRAVAGGGLTSVYSNTALVGDGTAVDLTDHGGTISAQYPREGEYGHTQLIDNSPTTKFRSEPSLGWVQYRSPTRAIVNRYTITSADDAADRDPGKWTLQGSADGATWTTLDTRTGQTFKRRGMTRGYSMPNTTAYDYYRLAVTGTNGAADMQFAEWELWAGGDRALQAPSTLLGTAVTTSEVDLTWRDNSNEETGYSETGFQIERSIDGTAFTPLAATGANINFYTDTGLTAGKKYYYRVRAVAAGGLTTAYSNVAPVTTVVGDGNDDNGSARNLMQMPGTITDQYDKSDSQGRDQAIDQTVYSKYHTTHDTLWLRYALDTAAVANRYSITSADDAPLRDPRSWSLQGSADGTTWVTLDSRANEAFSGRFRQRSFSFANTTAYRHYRLNITATNGSPDLQLAEWGLFGVGTPVAPPLPEAPSGLQARAVSGDQIILTWKDNSRWEKSVRIERSADGSTWNWSRSLAVGTTRYHDLGLSGTTQYHYRVRAENTAGTSAYSNTANATTGDPGLPATWKEHWHEHDKSLTRMYYDNDVAIYSTSDFDRSQTWVNDYVRKLWQYTKSNYGSFSNPRLAAVLHPNPGGGVAGHIHGVFDSDADYRNKIDVTATSWEENKNNTRDVVAHEMAHIVEGGSNGVHNSPSFPIWEDSKWADIYVYDAFLGAGLTADAERWYADKIDDTDGYPRAKSAWFKDWFYPIWKDHGKSAVLSTYFKLLAQHFPQYNGEYARDLNWGEFVHFWSGAAGVNLKPLATSAFGWPDEWEQQFQQARRDFPNVQYPRSLTDDKRHSRSLP